MKLRSITITLLVIVFLFSILLSIIPFSLADNYIPTYLNLLIPISNPEPSLEVLMGCMNQSAYQTASFIASGFPPNTPVVFSLVDSTNHNIITTDDTNNGNYSIILNYPANGVTDSSGKWKGTFEYAWTRYSGNHSISIFVDKNKDNEPDPIKIMAISLPIECWMGFNNE